MTEIQPVYNVSTEKPWCCPRCGKQLGAVYRRNDIRHLRIEHAGLVVVVSMGAEVTCPSCSQMRTWHPGQEAMDELIEKSKRNIFKLTISPT